MYRSTASLMISRADLEATLEPWITNTLRGRGAPPQSQGCSVQDLMSAPVVRLISRMVEPPEPMMKPAARRVTLRMICLQVERLQPPDESACSRLWPESFCWAILHTSSENSCSLLSKSRRPDVATHPFAILSSSTIPCSSFSTPCPRCLGPEGWIQALGGTRRAHGPSELQDSNHRSAWGVQMPANGIRFGSAGMLASQRTNATERADEKITW